MTGKTLTETAEDLLATPTPPTRIEQAKAARGARLWTWIARGTGIILVVSTLGFGAYLAAANAGARTERIELIAQLDEERAKVDALYEQLRSIGEDPVVEPGKGDSTPAEPGATGPTGPQGVPGRDGSAPSAAEVLDAIAAYCAANNGCRGVPGLDGKNGTNGESIVGPAGQDGKDGANGTNGLDGVNGMNGVSVMSVSCVLADDLSTAFRFTFSDGAFSDVAGPCLP